MLAPRPIHLFACLVAYSLALAGCAGAGGDAAQNLVSGEPPPRSMTVLVNDLEFSPDVEVVDRGFGARLASVIGNEVTPDIIKSITVRRVSDEVTATIVAILHEEANLNAKPGTDEDISPNAATLVVTGRLHAAEQGSRAQRNPVPFGAGVAVDAALLQVGEGGRKQLLNFTTQAHGGPQSGAAMTAQIGAVLAKKSSANVNLSPDVQAEARGLGRAIADKIVAYTVQQGWARKVSSPEPPPAAGTTERKPMEKRSAEKRSRNSPAAAEKQAAAPPIPSPPKPFPCQAFTRNERGNWYVAGPVTVDIGNEKDKTLANQEIPRGFFTIGGVDLYGVIQKECGNRFR